MSDDRWIDWGGEGPVLHFAHANGFPPATYRRLLEGLTPAFQVVTAASRPLWDGGGPVHLDSWRPLAKDLVDALHRRHLSGVVGVGHSLGAVLSVWAAAAEPELFSALVLVDPMLMTGPVAQMWRLMKLVGLSGSIPIARGARRRRDSWPDRATARAAWAQAAAFSSWPPEVLEDYLEAGLRHTAGGGLTLSYPKAWEARIFEVAPHDVWPELSRLAIPILLIQGERTDPFLRPASSRARRELRNGQVEVIPGASHLVPMEQPQRVAQLIREWWAEAGTATQ